MGAKVVLVGFDGADRTEIARMADGGQLPVLARMRAEGLWGKLDAFDGLGDDAAWSSFATGVGSRQSRTPLLSLLPPPARTTTSHSHGTGSGRPRSGTP